jgi:flavin reductase (DIM6/NTAB) family NADH-FMN oxidoreductase RutF
MAGSPASSQREDRLVELPLVMPIWEQLFLVAPLVIVGTRERDGFDLAPKHMAMPLGWRNLFCFACSPEHSTYRNAVAEGAFTVSFPQPEQVVEASLAAGGRLADGSKPALAVLPTIPARKVDGVLVEGAALHLECELERIVDGFDGASLVVGQVVAAAAREEMLRSGEVDDGDLVRGAPLLAYISPGRFATVEDTLAFPFPIDFRR